MEYVLRFCQFLRTKSCPVGTAEIVDLLEALRQVPFRDERRFKRVLKALLARDRRCFEHFDEWYDTFVFYHEKEQQSRRRERSDPTRDNRSLSLPSHSWEELKSWYRIESSEEELPAYSPVEIWTRKDFRLLDEQEVRRFERLLQRHVQRWIRRRSRLRKATKRITRLDLRRTVRRRLRRGTLDRFVFSTPKEKPLRIVLLCDVSRSMDIYSRFVVHFLYAFQGAYDRIETFVFSTRLYRITDLLKQYHIRQAFQRISVEVPHWSGGTDIGTCLWHFIRQYRHIYVDRRTVVLILSDGWDCGDHEALARAMQLLHRSAAKIIWLNPLAGNPHFRPEVVGMKAAMPYIDVFASAHNVHTLIKVFRQIPKGRSKRQIVIRS